MLNFSPLSPWRLTAAQPHELSVKPNQLYMPPASWCSSQHPLLWGRVSTEAQSCWMWIRTRLLLQGAKASEPTACREIPILRLPVMNITSGLLPKHLSIWFRRLVELHLGFHVRLRLQIPECNFFSKFGRRPQGDICVSKTLGTQKLMGVPLVYT